MYTLYVHVGTYTQAYPYPSMHKPTIHRKILNSSFLHHPLTEHLLITMIFFSPHNLLFSSYATISVIQLKMHSSRNVRFKFHIRTPFTNSPRTNHFVFDECLQNCGPNFARCVVECTCRFHLWHKREIDQLHPAQYWKIAFCGQRSVYASAVIYIYIYTVYLLYVIMTTHIRVHVHVPVRVPARCLDWYSSQPLAHWDH